ncbi:acyl-CoA dehydrogenase family protein [Ponticaulis sp.]|uniref:acyl-CoA dehydrogenase family protein n=1 Tax=Ponticaulis sp. TaxID=2020902 RepID=UPI000B67145A|nr:acyl-CoA dehydrogenase family protein [Ponticaulis sp.]MAI88964.1 pimeloyl-CoA dehydrogenase small subunit [Ponticaulis sp.]OUY01651.1 MAG: pimeloyl-CoA dehydrogenase small subunit [Hyphomonadaceae bacterium TMED5]
MDFSFTEEQNMIRDSLSRMIREQYDWETRNKVITSESGWRPEMWAQFAELGLFMAPFSEEDGGLGGNAVDAMVIMEEFGKGLVVEPFVPSVVLGGGFLKHGGSAAQKEEFLAPMMGGETIFAFAYAEPTSRFNLNDVTTTAKANGSSYVLNGQKSVVLGAPWATHLVVTARTSGDRFDESGISVFIVPKDAAGISTRDYPTMDGYRASEVYFENVEVSGDAMIGEEGAAFPLIEKVTDEGIAAICSEACGAMEIANADTIEYAKQRKQFNVPISTFQVLQHRMVDMFIEQQQSVSMTYQVTLRLEEDADTRKKAASAAKVQIGNSGRFIGQAATQIHGGMGVTDELRLGHYFKRLSLIDTQFGNVDYHLRRYASIAEKPVAIAAE